MSLPLSPTTVILSAAGAAVLLVLLLVWALVVLRRRTRRRAARVAASRAGTPASADIASSTSVSPVLPGPPGALSAPASSRVSESDLAAELRRRLAGSPLDTVADVGGLESPLDRVMWVENGHELLVHLNSLVVRVRPGLVLVSLDVEADQAGRTTVVVPFAVSAEEAGSLVAVTEESPRGDLAVVAHWGAAIQEALWAALLGIVADAASRLGHLPTAFAAADGTLHLQSAPVAAPVAATATVRAG